MTFQVFHDPYEPWIYKNFTYLLSRNNLACAYALHLFIYVSCWFLFPSLLKK